MFILATAALFAACGDKDNANDPSDSPSGGGDNPGSSTYAFSGRKLTKVVVSRDMYPGTIWTYDLSWDGNHLTEIKETAWYGTRHVVVSYDGDRPVALNAYKDGSLYSSASYTYSGGRVSRVLYMEPEHDSDSPEPDSAWMRDYTYSDGKISKITHTNIDELQYHRHGPFYPGDNWSESRAISEYTLTWDGNNLATRSLEYNASWNEFFEQNVRCEYSDKKNPLCPPLGLFGIEIYEMLSGNPAGWECVRGNNAWFDAYWSENIVSNIKINGSDAQQYELSWTFDGDYPSKLIMTINEDGYSDTYTVAYTYVD